MSMTSPTAMAEPIRQIAPGLGRLGHFVEALFDLAAWIEDGMR